MLRLARGFLLFVSILNGVSAMICGVLFLVKPDGSLLGGDALLAVIRTLPLANVFFTDFLWIGIAMLLALAIPNLTATMLLVRRHRTQYLATLVAAVLMALWCGFELIYMFNIAAAVYFAVTLVSAAASLVLNRQRPLETSA